MQEGRVSVAGQYHPLPRPFHVLATQNPLEQEGTYPLPEAQLDRFLLQIDVGYPDLEAERRMLVATTGIVEEKAMPVMTAQELLHAQRLVRRIPVGESVVEAILALVRAGRPDTSDDRRRRKSMSPGVRGRAPAKRSCWRAARAPCWRTGLRRRSTTCWRWLRPVLRHRMALNFAARADGITLSHVIDG